MGENSLYLPNADLRGRARTGADCSENTASTLRQTAHFAMPAFNVEKTFHIEATLGDEVERSALVRVIRGLGLAFVRMFSANRIVMSARTEQLHQCLSNVRSRVWPGSFK